MSASIVDPVGPLKVMISVTEIRHRPGTRLPVDRSIEVSGLALTDVAVPDGAELELHGELESIHEGVVLTGEVAVPWEGCCRRCLQDVSGVATVELREVFERRPVEGETWPLDQDHVDLGPLLRDSALLALPLAPLCGESCQGPDPDDYPTTVQAEERPEPDDERVKDPRWNALDDLDL